ncbi:MAG: P pilus assembly chaperone PapD [Colwellia sp.]|jgi:P pilus assembly chaperone PapD
MNISQVNIKKIAIKLYVLASIAASFSAQSASISSYRIYLDKDKSAESFIVFSKNTVDENCRVTLIHNDFDGVGKMTRHPNDSIPVNSAKAWMRFTPKYFKLSASTSQAIRFSMRRKAKTQPAEYRSYIAVNCEEIVSPKLNINNPLGSIATMKIVPMMVQNVPVIVRSGKLNAKLTFGTTKLSDGKIDVTLNRTGNRSVYGRLSLIDKSSGDEITFQKGISMYTETTSSNFHFSIGTISPEQIQLRFEEDKRYGGNIIIERDLIQ